MSRKLMTIVAIGGLALMSACGKPVTIKKGSAPVTDLNSPGVQPRATPSTRAIRGRQSAVRHLVTSARRQARQGHFSTAMELLERGLRIDPYNAQLYANMASIRFKQKRYQQAEQLAGRSNSLASGNRVLKLKNWRLIAESRSLRGDKEGAEAASRKVRELLQ